MAKEKQEKIDLIEFHFPAEGVTVMAKDAADAIEKLNELKLNN